MSDLGNKDVFAANLNYYIKEKGVMQKDVAAHCGVSTGTCNDWVKGRAYPRMGKIQKLADYFGVDKSDLIEEHSIRNPYHLKKEANKLSDELSKDPGAIELYSKIKKLSPHNRSIVIALVDSLTKEEK